MIETDECRSAANKSSRFFNPCKGDFYGTEKSILSKKMLVVGASHYCRDFYECGNACGNIAKSPECVDFTLEVIDTFFSSKERYPWMRTYSRFANSVFGRDASFEDQCKFYQSVVFVNYLQRTEGKNENEKHTSWFRNLQNADAFKQTIEEYTPDVIVVWGARVWPALPWKDFTIDATRSTDNAKKCCCMGIPFTLLQVHHPSMGYVRDTHFQLFRENGVFIIDPK